MSSREPNFRQFGSGPTGPRASCEQLAFVSRLAVDNPSGLKQEPWVTHLRACPPCRAEVAAHARAVSIFHHVEGESLAGHGSALTWEALHEALHREEIAHRAQGRIRGRWGIPAAAVAAGIIAVTAVIAWESWQDEGGPAPARIVRVEPPEQRSMEQMVRWTLESGEPGGDPLGIATAPSARGAGAEADWSLGVPDSRELAASVAPPQQETVGNDRIAPPSGRGPVISPVGERRPAITTQPAGNRFGRSPSFYKLEHRFIPTQPVSFPIHD